MARKSGYIGPRDSLPAEALSAMSALLLASNRGIDLSSEQAKQLFLRGDNKKADIYKKIYSTDGLKTQIEKLAKALPTFRMTATKEEQAILGKASFVDSSRYEVGHELNNRSNTYLNSAFVRLKKVADPAKTYNRISRIGTYYGMKESAAKRNRLYGNADDINEEWNVDNQLYDFAYLT